MLLERATCDRGVDFNVARLSKGNSVQLSRTKAGDD